MAHRRRQYIEGFSSPNRGLVKIFNFLRMTIIQDIVVLAEFLSTRSTTQMRSVGSMSCLALACLTGGCSITPNRQIGLTFYLCGCNACARFAKSAGSEFISSGTIVFAGGPGDAAEFRKKFGTTAKIKDDPDGSLTRAAGVKECPTAVVANRSSQVVLGNGSLLTREEIERAFKALEVSQ